MKMNQAWIAISLAAICCCAESRADEGGDTLDAIQNAYHEYADHVKNMSVRISWSVSLNGDDMKGYTVDHIMDRRNAFWQSVFLYDNYALQQGKNPDVFSFATITRIRGRYRQSFRLRRASPTSTWVLTHDTSEPLTKENESLSFEEERIGGLQQLEAIRFAPGYWLTTIPELTTRPGFRLGDITENRTGPERLVTMAFTIDPPLDQKAARMWPSVQAGRMVLRPDAYWTLKSGTFQLETSSLAGKILQCKVTNTFHEDSEKKALPKEVKCVGTVITKEGKNAEEINRATLEFSSCTQVPEERLSLTQFGLSEREPVDAKREPIAEAKPSPSGERDTKNYLVASSSWSFPPYVWLTGGGFLLLVIGIALRVWLTKSAKIHGAGVPPPPSAAG
jgi:hypothetical protein